MKHLQRVDVIMIVIGQPFIVIILYFEVIKFHILELIMIAHDKEKEPWPGRFTVGVETGLRAIAI